MKKILKCTLIYLLFGFTFLNVSADDDRNDFVSWEKPRISSVYNEADKKLVFLVQFKTHDYTEQVYKYDFKITTGERSKSCRGNFIITKTTIYSICGILISDLATLETEYNLYIETRDTLTNKREAELSRFFNKGATVKQLDSHIKKVKTENIPNKTSEGDDQNQSINSNIPKTLEINTQLNNKLNLFFEKIEKYSLKKQGKIIEIVLLKLTTIKTNNEQKKQLIELIRDRLIQEREKKIN